MASFLVRTGRRLEDQRDRALHVVLNRRARTILRIELAKRLRRRWADLGRGLREGLRRVRRMLVRRNA
jgi:hypothetical protein